ncbi:MAG: helix-turn-helix transcriptional regulator [Clostridia bacterium]|nr:helix-turn-helix transcriptional regulator [Clostridia bacterium]
MKFHEKIRAAREDMDLSQSEVAAKIPMNQSNYSKIERGIQEPSIDQLRKICQILHVDPRYLLDVKDFEISEYDSELLADARAFIKKHKNRQ